MTLSLLDTCVIGVYLALVLGVGLWFGKSTSSTDEFFFAGRRFGWKFIAVSCVATLVGSYSFIQYSEVGYKYGFSGMMPYTNEWFVLPFFLVAWLPIIYLNNIQSVPEYFERRYNRTVRMFVLAILMIYLINYIGINLLTIGIAIDNIVNTEAVMQSVFAAETSLSDWPLAHTVRWQIILPSICVALFSMVYLHKGGQNSVIMTDLFQGFLLLFAGIAVLVAGISALGGWDSFWQSLPRGHKLPFTNFNRDPSFNAVGDFWNDAMVGTFAFYVINQGMLMRFLSAKSVQDGRKAMLVVAMFLMPIAAISVTGAGWVGKALEGAGLIDIQSQKDVFIRVSEFVLMPGVYGVIVAAVVAALMSTLDTLITAVAALAVNDMARVFFPNKTDNEYLSWARIVSIAVTCLGILLVPVFDQFDSIYRALSYFGSIIVPPLAVAIFFSVFFRSFSARCVLATLILGSLILWVSVFFTDIITPFAHGIPADKGYSYIRSFFGVFCSSLVAIISMVFWRESDTKVTRLTLDSLPEGYES